MDREPTRRIPVVVSTALILIILGLALAAANLWRPKAAAAPSPTHDDARMQDLAERLLAPPPYLQQPWVDTAGQDALVVQTVQVLPGELPGDLPLTPWLPPGAEVVGSAVRRLNGEVFHMMVVLDAPGRAAELMDSYERDMAMRGWQPLHCDPPNSPGGFLPERGFRGGSFSDRVSGCFTVSILERDGAPTDIRLHFDLPAFWATRIDGPPPTAGPLPSIYELDGIQLHSTEGAVLQDEAKYTTATAETERSVLELESLYGQKLRLRGWTRRAAGGGDGLAWSTWDVPGLRTWQGFLIVRELPENRRSLYLRVDATAPRFEPVPGSGPYVVPGPGDRLYDLPPPPTPIRNESARPSDRPSTPRADSRGAPASPTL
jgi:hypothetical protein